jgi:MFS family permease
LRRNQIAAATAAFVGFTGFTLVMPFLPLYIRELGVTDTREIALWTGLTLGITPAITALCAPFWGRIGDRVGNKLLLQRALASGGLAMVSIAFAAHVWQLFALRAAVGFFAGFGSLTLAMAAISAPRDRMAEAIGTVQMAQRMGPAFGPVIGGVLAPVFGLRNAFIAAGSLYWLALLVVAIFYREPSRERAATDPHRGNVRFRGILGLENVRLMMVTIFAFQSVERSFGPVLALYLVQLGYSNAQTVVMAGILFSVLAFAGSFGNTMSGRLLARMPARRLIATASMLAAVALALFAAVSGWLLGIAIAVFGLSIGTGMTAAFAAGGSAIPVGVRATGFGFLTAASMLGVALAPVISGVVGGRSIRAVFVTDVAALIALGLGTQRFMVDRVASPPPEMTGATVEPE